MTLTIYNSKKLLLTMRRSFGSDQKVLKRLVLVCDKCRFRIYLTESIALRYNVLIRTFLRLGVAGFKVVTKGKTFLGVFVL